MENREPKTIQIDKDQCSIVDFFNSLPAALKQDLPLPLFHLKEITGRPILVDKSRLYHTDQLACFWFYKPISQMFKTFDE